MNTVSPTARPRTKHSAALGFTLVELLVVVAIIAMLLSLVLPNLGAAMARGRSVKCQISLRDIGQLMQMYVDDRQGFLPPVATDWEATQNKHHWCQFLAPYAGVPLDPNTRTVPTPTPAGWKPGELLERQWWGVFPRNNIFWGCPSWRAERPTATASKPGYGMNGYLRSPAGTFTGDSNHPIRLLNVTFPSNRALVADAPDWHITGASNFNNGNYGFQDWSRGSPFRHGTRANYLFCDLSVRSVSYLRAHMAFWDPQQFKEE